MHEVVYTGSNLNEFRLETLLQVQEYVQAITEGDRAAYPPDHLEYLIEFIGLLFVVGKRAIESAFIGQDMRFTRTFAETVGIDRIPWDKNLGFKTDAAAVALESMRLALAKQRLVE